MADEPETVFPDPKEVEALTVELAKTGQQFRWHDLYLLAYVALNFMQKSRAQPPHMVSPSEGGEGG